MRLPPLPALRAFEAAARHLSFTRAAEELFVTQGAVSQQVKQLESYLGFKLFYRLPRKLVLTEEGVRLSRAAHEAFMRVAGEIESLLAVEEAGMLTVSVLQSFAVKWLIPRLGRFKEEHPEIDVRVHADDRLVDFHSDGVDLAVRFGRGGYANLAVDQLMDETVFPVCSPKLLDGPKPLGCPEDLRAHTLFHDATGRQFDLSGSDWRAWFAAAGVTDVSLKGGPAFNSGDMAIQAAIMGQGVALARASLAFDDLEAGLLVRPFPQTVRSRIQYYICCPEENLERPRVRAFVDWLHREAAVCRLDDVA